MALWWRRARGASHGDPMHSNRTVDSCRAAERLMGSRTSEGLADELELRGFATRSLAQTLKIEHDLH